MNNDTNRLTAIAQSGEQTEIKDFDIAGSDVRVNDATETYDLEPSEKNREMLEYARLDGIARRMLQRPDLYSDAEFDATFKELHTRRFLDDPRLMTAFDRPGDEHAGQGRLSDFIDFTDSLSKMSTAKEQMDAIGTKYSASLPEYDAWMKAQQEADGGVAFARKYLDEKGRKWGDKARSALGMLNINEWLDRAIKPKKYKDGNFAPQWLSDWDAKKEVENRFTNEKLLMGAAQMMPFLTKEQRNLINLVAHGADPAEFSGILRAMKKEDRNLMRSMIQAVRPEYKDLAWIPDEGLVRAASSISQSARGFGRAAKMLGYRALYTGAITGDWYNPLSWRLHNLAPGAKEEMDRMRADFLEDIRDYEALSKTKFSDPEGFISKATAGFFDSSPIQFSMIGGELAKRGGAEMVKSGQKWGYALQGAGYLMQGYTAASMIGEHFDNMLLNGIDPDKAVALSFTGGLAATWIERWNLNSYLGLNLSSAEMKRIGVRAAFRAGLKMNGKELAKIARTNAKQALVITSTELGEEVAQALEQEGMVEVGRGKDIISAFTGDTATQKAFDALVEALPTCSAFGFMGTLDLTGSTRNASLDSYRDNLDVVSRAIAEREGKDALNLKVRSSSAAHARNMADRVAVATAGMSNKERAAWLNAQNDMTDAERAFYAEHCALKEAISAQEGSTYANAILSGSINEALFEKEGWKFDHDESGKIIGITSKDGNTIPINIHDRKAALEEFDDQAVAMFIEEWNEQNPDKSFNANALTDENERKRLESTMSEYINGLFNPNGGISLYLGNNVTRDNAEHTLTHEIIHKLLDDIEKSTTREARKTVRSLKLAFGKFYNEQSAIEGEVAAQGIAAANRENATPDTIDWSAVAHNVGEAFKRIGTLGIKRGEWAKAFKTTETLGIDPKAILGKIIGSAILTAKEQRENEAAWRKERKKVIALILAERDAKATKKKAMRKEAQDAPIAEIAITENEAKAAYEIEAKKRHAQETKETEEFLKEPKLHKRKATVSDYIASTMGTPHPALSSYVRNGYALFATPKTKSDSLYDVYHSGTLPRNVRTALFGAKTKIGNDNILQSLADEYGITIDAQSDNEEVFSRAQSEYESYLKWKNKGAPTAQEMEYQYYRESVLAAVTPDEWRAHEKARMEMEDLDSMAFFGLISQADAASGKIEIATRPELSEIYRKLGEVNPAHVIDDFYDENGTPRFSIAAQQEYSEVYNRYHNPDGTPKAGWRKAPNGEPTKLTERQWVQVRTPSFKKWFGDWEAAAELSVMRDTIEEWTANADNLAWAKGRTLAENEAKFGDELKPIAYIPKHIAQYFTAKAKDNRVYSSKGYFIDHIANHGHNDIGPNEYRMLQDMFSSPDEVIKDTRVKPNGDNRDSLLFVKRFAKNRMAVVELSEKDGQIILHKSLYNTRDRVYPSLPRIDLSEGGRSSISRAADATPGGSLSARDNTDKLSHYLSEVNPSSVSKVVDENGEPTVVYHATNNDEATSVWDERTKQYLTSHKPFTIFKRKVDGLRNNGHFFTSDRSNAEGYGNTTYACYLNIRNPLVIDCNGSDYSAIKHDGRVLDTYEWAQWAEKNGHDGVIFKNVRDGVDYGAMQKPSDEYVVFSSNQIKSATENIGTFGSTNADIRFSIAAPVERSKNLIALHNLKPSDLAAAAELEGMPAPSIAVVKDSVGHDNYGPISFVFGAGVIDPKADRNNKIYSSDAWTPTRGSVNIEYKVLDEKLDEIIASLINDGDENYRKLFKAFSERGSLGDTAENAIAAGEYYRLWHNDAILLSYLHSKGQSVPLSFREQAISHNYSNAVVKGVAGAVGDKIAEIWENGGKAGDEEAVKRMSEIMRPAAVKAKDDENPEGAAERRAKGVPTLGERLYGAALKRPWDLAKAVIQYREHGITEEIDTFAVSKTMSEILSTDDPAYQEWVRKTFAPAVGAKGIRNKRELFTPSGSRRSWETLHDEVTAQRIVDMMYHNSKEVGGNGFGGYNPEGAAVRQYASIAEMRRDRDRLQAMPEEEWKKLRDETRKDFIAAVSSLQSKQKHFYSDNVFVELDSIQDIVLQAWIAAKGDKEKYLANCKDELHVYDESDCSDIWDVMMRLRNAPTKYFEAKPERVVGFDEVAFAVVPDDSSAETVDILKTRGIETHTYKAEDKEDRLRVLNEAANANNIRFSIGGIYTGSAADYDNPSLHYVGKSNGVAFGWGLYGSSAKSDAINFGDNVYEQTYFINRAPGDESHLIEWDKPLTDENQERILDGLTHMARRNANVKNAVESVLAEEDRDFGRDQDEDYEPQEVEGMADDILREAIERTIDVRSDTGKSVYIHLAALLTGKTLGEVNSFAGRVDAFKAASEFLRDECEIDGIKYPAEADGAKLGETHYVAFSDEHIRVDHKWVDGEQRFSIGRPDSRRALKYYLAREIVENGSLPSSRGIVNTARHLGVDRYEIPQIIAEAQASAAEDIKMLRYIASDPKIEKLVVSAGLTAYYEKAIKRARQTAIKYSRDVSELKEKSSKALERTVRTVRGEEYDEMLRRDGIDINAILLAMRPDERKQPSQSSSPETGNADAGNATPTPQSEAEGRAAAQSAIARAKELVEAAKAAAATAPDTSTTGNNAQNATPSGDKGDTAASDNKGATETDPMAGAISKAYYRAIAESGITLDNPTMVVQLIKAQTERYILDNPAKVSDLDRDNVFDSPIARAIFAGNVASFAQAVAAAYAPSYARIRISKKAQLLNDHTVNSSAAIERVATEIFEDLHRDIIRQSRNSLISDIKKLLKKGAKGYSERAERQDRKVSADAQAWCKAAIWAIDVAPSKVEEESANLQSILQSYGSSKSEAENSRYRDFAEAQLKLSLLTSFGKIRERMPAELAELRDYVGQLVDEGVFDAMTFSEKWEATRNAVIEDALPAIVGNPKDKGREPEKTSWLYSLVGMIEPKWRQLTRFCRDDKVRERSLKAMGTVETMIQTAYDKEANYRTEQRNRLKDLLISVYGSESNARKALNADLDEKLWAELDRGEQHTEWTVGRVLQMYVSCVQSDYADNCEKYKRGADYAAKLEEIINALDPRHFDLIRGLREFYLAQGDDLSEVYVQTAGVPLWTPNRNYMPVAIENPHNRAKDAEVRTYNPYATSLTPRVKHGLDFDQKADIIETCFERINDAAHTIGWADTGSLVIGICQSDRILNAIRKAHGRAAMGQWNRYILDVVAPKAELNTMEAKFAKAMMRFASRLWIGLNIKSWAKQLASAPCYALSACGRISDVAASLSFWALHPAEGIKVARDLSETRAFQARYGLALSQELKYATSSDGALKTWWQTTMDKAMSGVYVFDKLGTYLLAGIYRRRRMALEQDGMPAAEASEVAAAWLMHIVDKTAQSGRTVNTTELQRAGGAWAFILQFKSAPAQQTQFEIVAVQEALANLSDAKRWKKAAAVIAINHFIVPAITTSIDALLLMLTGWGIPDEEKRKRLAAIFAANVLSGSLGSIAVLGTVIEGVARGSMDWAIAGKKPSARTVGNQPVPMFSVVEHFWNSGNKAMKAFEELQYGDIENGVIDMVEAIGGVIPGISSPVRTATKTIRSIKDK